MRYRMVIFDFDGTLADSLPWLSSVVNDVLRAHGGRSFSSEELEAMRSAGARENLRRAGVRWWRLPGIAADVRGRMRRARSAIPLFEGVDVMLKDLSHAGVKLAVVSSNAEDNVRAILGPDGAARISHWGCSASLFGKAAKLRAVLKASGFRAAEVLSVGDETRDIAPSRAQGMDFGAVTWGFTGAEALRAHRPTYVFNSLDELRLQLAA